ncbi:hypothetical protein [Frankia sp. Cas3]|uniref:hypothetical protein n=1 Tax=Frankia sp. Cas3 TaxID=3073926 RepID=UPI002AD505F0|nr:hypothetical protein [Frankia sp. Cas3]
MAQLPRVAVLGRGPTAGVTVFALVDSGLDARLFVPAAAPARPVVTGAERPATVTAAPTPAEDYLRERGLADRITRLDGDSGIRPDDTRPVDTGRRPFDLRGSDQQVTRWDVVVVTEDPVEDQAEDQADRAAGPSIGSPLFGGVFSLDTDGVYRCGRLPGSVDGSVDGADTVRLADAQGRWISEYLRGRYLLPPRSVMLAAAGLPAAGPASWLRSHADRLRASWHGRHRRPGRPAVQGYLRWLGAELRRGRARAAEGGYPIPVPSLITAE